MIKIKKKIKLIAIACVVCSNITFADTITQSLNATASVQKSCNISATPVSFSNYSAGTNPGFVYSTGTLTVLCNKTSAAIMLNGGDSGTVKQRRMYNGSNSLLYQLYINNSYNTVWTDMSWYTGSDYLYIGHDASIGVSKTYTIYARMSGKQYVVPGSYTDTITATLQY